ncbi:MAG: hypothetical protein JW797_16545 [Bradymonadales bacterium]|nr:hypothetical protein [Bradymonadales bacterium]
MYFRTKLIAIFAATVLILLVVAYLMLIRPLLASCDTQVRGQLMPAARAVAVMHRIEELTARVLVTDLAAQPRLRQALVCDPAYSLADCDPLRHRQAAAAIDQWYRPINAALERNRSREIGSRSLDAPFSQPLALLIVATTDGTVVARHIGDVSDWYGPGVLNLRASNAATFAVVSDALLEDSPQHDIVAWQESSEDRVSRTLMLVAAAPIHQWTAGGGRGSAVGVALLGFPITAPSVADKQTALGEVALAYTLGTELIAHSDHARLLQRCTDGSWTDSAGGLAFTALPDFIQRSSTDTVYEFHCQGQSYRVVRQEFAADRAGTDPFSYLLVGSLSPELSRLRQLTIGLPLLGILLALVGLVAMVMVVNRFLAPLERIDQGIQQVIAGNRDHVWQVDSRNPYHAEMAQALNLMSATLQGKPLPDEEQPRDDAEWESLLQFAEVEITGQYASIDLIEARRAERRRKAELAAQEPVESYRRRLYEEFCKAKAEVGQGESPISFDRFVGQIAKKAQIYKDQHDCKDVRFEVTFKNGQVVLKPIAIK